MYIIDCMTCIIHRQLQEFKAEEKLYLGYSNKKVECH
jgi:hypothetical protein